MSVEYRIPSNETVRARIESMESSDRRAIEAVAEYLASSLSDEADRTFQEIAEKAIWIYLDVLDVDIRSLRRRIEILEGLCSNLADLDQAIDVRAAHAATGRLDEPS